MTAKFCEISGVRPVSNSALIAKAFVTGADREFPFSNAEWIAIAFERNRYGYARMPEWFFRLVAAQFGADGQMPFLIEGDGFVRAGLADVCVIPFDWESYLAFMSRADTYSLEYRMASADLACGCWADPDITIFGGNAPGMSAAIASFGGEDAALKHMRDEFLLGDVSSYEEMDRYFRCLLRPELRGEAS